MRKEEIEKLNCLVDLHLHLDGAISVESAKMLAKMQGIPIPADEKELEEMIRVSDDCRDLTEFLKRFAFPCSLLLTKEGIRQAVRNLLQEWKDCGVMYAEIRFAPQHSINPEFRTKGMSDSVTFCETQEDAVVAALEGIHEGAIPANLILCCMRGPETKAKNLETLRLTEKYLGKGVVSADLAGAEALFPNTDYTDLFREAKRRGIPFILHAGEAAGPESIRTALAMEPLRIGHGVHAFEDPALVKELAAMQMPLELCPTSNLKTAVFKDLKDYPLPMFLKAGVYVTINSDDPAIEGTTIQKEYANVAEQFDLSRDCIKQLLQNSVKASFAADEWKQNFLQKIEDNFAAL